MDKNKIIEAAAKLVAKGAYDKAIKEYQKVLDADPRDVRTLQKMGELYQKKNDNGQAALYFTRVAESYTNDGFFLKAVALYKQVLKLDGSLVDVNVKLAELHQQLQLVSEAMGYYQIVAAHYDKAGDTKKSLEVLKRMVELDPDNVASRVKLADLYVREGMNGEALEDFQRAAVHLKRQNRTDDYLRVAERVSTLDPSNLTLARELAELYLQRNDQKRALAKLQVCFKADARDIDTLRLLAVAFHGLGQTSKTVSAYKELARAYQDRGMVSEAEGVWQQLRQLEPHDSEVLSRYGSPAPEPVRVSSPPPGAAAPPPARPERPAVAPAPPTDPAAPAPADSGRPRGEANLAKLLTETDVYVKYGLHDKALEHLRKVFNAEPENIDAHEKAYAIYVAANNPGQAFEQLLNVLRLHTRRGDAPRAQPYLATILEQNPNHPEVPVFVSALQLEGGAAPAATDPDDGEDGILVDSSDDEVIVAEEPAEVGSGVAAGSADLEPAEVLEDEPALGLAATGEEEALDEAQVVPDFEAPVPAGVMAFEEEPPTGQHGLPIDEVPTTNTYAVQGAQGGPSPSRGSERPAAGFHSPGQLHPLGAEDDDDSSAPFAEPDAELLDAPLDEAGQFAPPPEEPVEAPPDDEPASEECDEATFFMEQGLYDEAREILETITIAYPEHRRAAALLTQLESLVAGGGPGPEAAEASAASPGGANGANSGRDAFDLAAELADELGAYPEASSGLSDVGGASGEYQVSVEEVFSEFKKGLEKVVKPEDVDTHYDLGIAYKEMGLLDDAISEFTIARKGCLTLKKEIDCLTMIALLQLMKGEFAQAIESYQQALTSTHAQGDTEKALRYELASAYEGAGQSAKALGQFLKVQSLDGSYREVGQMVERLSALVQPEDEPPPPPPKPRGGGGSGSGGARKVGYV